MRRNHKPRNILLKQKYLPKKKTSETKKLSWILKELYWYSLSIVTTTSNLF